MMESSKNEDFMLKVWGLPWSCSAHHVQQFFSECRIRNGSSGIHFAYTPEGRPTGEAFIEVESENDVEVALKLAREWIEQGYMEVCKSSRVEMDRVLQHAGRKDPDSARDAFGPLRGPPLMDNEEDIVQLFSELEITPDGIKVQADLQGRDSEEAFVQCASQEIAGDYSDFLKEHEEKTGHMEIFRSNQVEVYPYDYPQRLVTMQGAGPYDRRRAGSSYKSLGRGAKLSGACETGSGALGEYNGYNAVDHFGTDLDYSLRRFGQGPGNRSSTFLSPTDHWLPVRGLPYQAPENDICGFLSPLKHLGEYTEIGSDGRVNGGADVEFVTHADAVVALAKDEADSQYRCGERFLNSTAGAASSSPYDPEMMRSTGLFYQYNYYTPSIQVSCCPSVWGLYSQPGEPEV